MASHPGDQQLASPAAGGSSGGGLGGAQFGDTTFTKIFVGGLAWETQRDTMRQYFEQFGEILEAVVITDKNTGRSKGYGFVTFKDPDSARRACENPTPVIDGRRANCNLAALGVRPRVPPFHQAAGRMRHFTPLIGSTTSHIPGASTGVGSQQQQHQQHQQQQQQQQQQLFYPPTGFSYAPYGYTYVHEYPYQSLYNPYGNPQLSAAAAAAIYGGSGSGGGGGGGGGGAAGLTGVSTGLTGGGGGGGAALYTYSGFGTGGYPSPSSYVAQSHPLVQYPAGVGPAYVAAAPLSTSAATSSSPAAQQPPTAAPSSASPGVCVLPIQA